MIALLRGTLAYKSSDHVIIDVGGVGYRLFIPLSTFYSLPETGDVSLFTHTHVREDALLLYGFLSLEEKELFGILISISGVGPKLAVNILSHIPAKDLKRAIASGDIKRLSSLPGIGKKTAERMIVELRERSQQMPVTAGTGAAMPVDSIGEASIALQQLGYKPAEISRMVKDARPTDSAEEIIRAALKSALRS